MKRNLEILVVCTALVIIGSYTWRHKEQALAIINPSREPARNLATPAKQEGIQTPVTTVNPPVGTTSSTTTVLPVLELTKVALSGKSEIFTTIEGDKYTGVIKRVEPDGIVLRTADGVSKLKFKNLPSEIAEKYGYDPEIEQRFLTCLQNASAASYQEELQLRDANEKLAIAAEAERKRSEQQAAENAVAMNQPPLHIKVNQVVKDGVLADLMETASIGSSMSRIGGGGGACIYYKRSGHVVYIEGVKNAVDDDELTIKAKRNGTFAYLNTLGANSTVEKYDLLMKVK